MGFRYRKTINIVPGIKLNISKSGVSTSIGRRGATVNIGHGRVKATVGIPRSGMSYSQSTALARSKNAAAVRQRTRAASQPKIPASDKVVLDAISAADVAKLDKVARKGRSEHAQAAAMLAGLIAVETQPVWARQMLEWVWTQGHDPAGDRLVTTYLAGMRLPVQITSEIEIDEALGRNLIGLMIAEWKQSDGDVAGAIGIVEQLEPTPAAALSLAELYFDMDRNQDLIDLTDGLSNGDDVTALLIVYRGMAFRELAQYESARLSFKEALRFRSRSTEVRFRALVERALTYHAEGKLGSARRDLDRIRAEDASYPGLKSAVTALGLDSVQADANGADDEVALAEVAGVSAAFGPPSLAKVVASVSPAAWHPDPTGRHQLRYWDGSRWTEHVSTSGLQAIDAAVELG